MKRALPPLIALFVGAITLAFTIGLCVHERDNEQARLRAVFDANARQAAGRIEQRIANYEQMLRGVQGLLSADQGIDRIAFEAYVDTVMAGPDAAGLQSVAFSVLVPHGGLADHIGHQRMTGRSGYDVRPAGERDVYAPIVLVAPDTVANRQVIGYDSMSEATRRAAMLQARDSGNATLTALVQLRVDNRARAEAGLPDLPAGLRQGRVRRHRRRPARARHRLGARGVPRRRPDVDAVRRAEPWPGGARARRRRHRRGLADVPLRHPVRPVARGRRGDPQGTVPGAGIRHAGGPHVDGAAELAARVRARARAQRVDGDPGRGASC